jgi:hypothetical protein
VNAGDFVLVQLVNPREKFWGILRDRDPSGVTVRGLTLDSFDGWMREIAKREPPSFFPGTVFFPMHRVERIFADETVGEVTSFADRFKQVVGEDARYHLTPMPEKLGNDDL